MTESALPPAGTGTVRVVEPEMFPLAAVIVLVPAAWGVANPAAVIVATLVFDEPQVTAAVRSRVVLFERVPVAVNCWVAPMATAGFAGVTAMETSAAVVTVRAVVPETAPDEAEIVVVPVATDVARPVALIVATTVLDDVQLTDVEISCVLLSEKVPLAVNCWVIPVAMAGFAGVTAMETSVLLLPPPPPPPQPNIRRTIGRRNTGLFNFITLTPGGNQMPGHRPAPAGSACVPTSRQQPRQFLPEGMLLSRLARGLLQGLPVLAGIGAEQRRKVRVESPFQAMAKTTPDDETYSRTLFASDSNS